MERKACKLVRLMVDEVSRAEWTGVRLFSLPASNVIACTRHLRLKQIADGFNASSIVISPLEYRILPNHDTLIIDRSLSSGFKNSLSH